MNALLPALVLVPLACGVLCFAFRNARTLIRALSVGVVMHGVLCVVAAARVFARRQPFFMADEWLFMDALSAYNAIVMAIVFTLSAVYAITYFDAEDAHGKLTLRMARQFAALSCATLSAMSLVLVSNHLAIMWIGIEATTLLTAFLICLHVTPTSLEAMWKYLLVCSVGVAFAFVGTLLVEVSMLHRAGPHDVLLWTHLRDNASSLDPMSLKAAFVFLVVGYGTKAGLSPMHSWLPDAHSQAPAPVSALFSGFMLNAALYCIVRYLPIVEAATGHAGFCLELLIGFGLVSMILAGAFILFQKDVKRLLAYSSVEHIGIMAVGIGLGGIGTFAALLHTLNHAICKPLAFFSAGRLGQLHGTHDIDALAGSLRKSPVWGIGLLVGLLALIGLAPFGIFITELLIVKAAVEKKAFLTLGLFLFGASVVFVGALRHALTLAWGGPSGAGATGATSGAPKATAAAGAAPGAAGAAPGAAGAAPGAAGAAQEAGAPLPISGAPPRGDSAPPETSWMRSPHRLDALIVAGCVAAAMLLGLWMPESLHMALELATAAIGGTW